MSSIIKECSICKRYILDKLECIACSEKKLETGYCEGSRRCPFNKLDLLYKCRFKNCKFGLKYKRCRNCDLQHTLTH